MRTMALAVLLVIGAGCASSAPQEPVGGEVGQSLATPQPATTPQAATTPPAPDEPAASTATPQASESSGESDDPPGTICAPLEPQARVDVLPTGNRVSEQPLDLAAATQRRIAVPGEPVWVIPHPAQPGTWFAVLEDDAVVSIDADDQLTEIGVTDPDTPPSIDARGFARPVDHRGLADPLPDTRIVTVDGLAADFGWDVWLAAPTDRYGHGVLGDRIEAAAIVAERRCGDERVRIEITEPDVVEGISPFVASFEDGEPLIVATLSNGIDGARLAAWNLAGELVAESEPIGRANRWRNQLALAPVGPEGEYELIDVRTPHLGGVVEYFRRDGDNLVRVAASAGQYTSHWIGSRNLDAGIVVDTDADGRLDVLVATSDRRSLAALTRVGDGVEETLRIDLGGLLSTNIAPGFVERAVAVGLAGGEVVIFESP